MIILEMPFTGVTRTSQLLHPANVAAKCRSLREWRYCRGRRAGTNDSTHPGLLRGTDIDVAGGAFHGRSAISHGSRQPATPGGPIPRACSARSAGPTWDFAGGAAGPPGAPRSARTPPAAAGHQGGAERAQRQLQPGMNLRIRLLAAGAGVGGSAWMTRALTPQGRCSRCFICCNSGCH
jgi:hypothetical protein